MYVSIIIGGGEGDEGALFCKTGESGEKQTGLAGTREREVRDPTPAGSPPLHPARLEPGPGPSPCQDFLEMLFQPLRLAKARAGGREAQRLQGQKSWGPLEATTASEVTCRR